MQYKVSPAANPSVNLYGGKMAETLLQQWFSEISSDDFTTSESYRATATPVLLVGKSSSSWVYKE